VDGEKRRLWYSVGVLLWAAGFVAFYYKYVPLVPAFQVVLIPALVALLIVTAVRLEWGFGLFILFLPLINSLPYFFGLSGAIPIAPTALVAGLVLGGGWLLHGAFFMADGLRFPGFLRRPLFAWALLLVISALITFWRYTDFVPVLSRSYHDVQVNATGVRAGGALMSSVFTSLNYLTGILVFGIAFRTLRSPEWRKPLIVLISAGTFIALLFGAVQAFFAPKLGNTPYWIGLHRINATFTDPNALGSQVAVCLPLFLSAMISLRGRMRLFFGAAIGLSLILLPFIGSRSSLIAIAVSLGTLSVLAVIEAGPEDRRWPMKAAAVAALLILVMIVAGLFIGPGSLPQRIRQDVGALTDAASISRIANFRLQLWRAAALMMRTYPFTGVGVGAYIIELPDTFARMGIQASSTDSALNYALQVGSETGFIGLGILLWLWFELFRGLKKSRRHPGQNGSERWIFTGAAGGIAALFAGFVFHTYIGNPEITYLFWVLVALALARPEAGGEKPNHLNRRPATKFLVFALLVSYTGIHFWNSARSLSPVVRAEAAGQESDFGLYEKETDSRGVVFRWTRRSAGFSIRNLSPTMVIPMQVSHPDVERNPVHVRVFRTDRHFRMRRLIQDVAFQHPGWMNFECPTQASPHDQLFFMFDISRTWKPGEMTDVRDPRSIGVALGEAWFRVPSELATERKSREIQTLSAASWEGSFGSELITNGTSRLRFRASSSSVAVRLHVRGTPARGVGPHLHVRFDNRLIGDTILEGEGWVDLVFHPAKCEPGEHELSVEFLNDLYLPDEGQDRNLFLGGVEILPKIRTVL